MKTEYEFVPESCRFERLDAKRLIKTLQAYNGIDTHEDMARVLGVSTATISAISSGTKRLSSNMILRIAMRFDLDVDLLTVTHMRVPKKRRVES